MPTLPSDAAAAIAQYAGPLAGALIAFRLVLRFQRDVVDGSTTRAAELERRLMQTEKKVDALEGDVAACDRRNAILIRALIQAGIEVPHEALEEH